MESAFPEFGGDEPRAVSEVPEPSPCACRTPPYSHSNKSVEGRRPSAGWAFARRGPQRVEETGQGYRRKSQSYPRTHGESWKARKSGNEVALEREDGMPDEL